MLELHDGTTAATRPRAPPAAAGDDLEPADRRSQRPRIVIVGAGHDEPPIAGGREVWGFPKKNAKNRDEP